MKKINLGLLFGGRSCEHEISIRSARSIVGAIDDNQYQVSLIGIDKNGYWCLSDNFDEIMDGDAVKSCSIIATASAKKSGGDKKSGGSSVTLDLHHRGNLSPSLSSFTNATRHNAPPTLDVIFPALHGTFGEDGTIQGLLEMTGIPYIGCGVAASALAMDKILAKKVFAAAGIPQAAHTAFNASQWSHDSHSIMQHGEAQLGYPIFVKPANLGSSVGISKAKTRAQLQQAIQLALRFDNKIILEQSMENCIEAECAVLGNADQQADLPAAPQASVVGEIIPGAEFYDYTTKYMDDKSELIIPANLPEHVAARARELAVSAFQEINGAGLARVDFFIHRETWKVVLNEVNTMPGFTPISMYPRLWAASGIPYPELIDKLIQLALTTHRTKATLQRALKPPA